MQELTISQQREVSGGGLGTVVLLVVIGTALYKVIFSRAGRISIPHLISIEWR